MADTFNTAPTAPVTPQLSRAARNVLSNWIGFIFSGGVAFFLSPFIVHHLGASGYGVWVLLMSLTGYLGLLHLGVRGAVTRYVARFHTLADHQAASRVVSSALTIYTAAGILAVLISLVLAFSVLGFFRIPQAYQSSAQIVLILAGFNIGVALVSGVFSGILVGLQRFDLSNAIEVVTTSLRAVAIVVALSLGEGLVALAWIHLIFALASGLAYVRVVLRSYPELKIRIGSSDRQHLTLIFSFSAYAFLLEISTNLIFYSDSVVIGSFLPVSMITFFAIAGSLTNYARMLISGISTTMPPLASALEAEGKKEELQKVLLNRTRYASLVVLPIALTFFLRGESFIRLWMGPEYGELSGRLLWILTLALVFASGNQVAGATMFGISKHKTLVPVFLGEALCNVALSIALVGLYGIIGVAWGTALPNLVVNLFFYPWYVRHVLGIPIQSYALSTWARPGIAVVPFALGTYAIEELWPAPNLILFFLQVGAVLPLAMLGYWFLCFTQAERHDYSQKFVQPLLRALLRT